MHPTSPRLQATIVVVLAMLGLVGTLVPPAAAEDVPWTVEPADNSFGADRQSYGYTLNPGGRIEDGVVVTNHGDTPLRLALDATPANWVQLDRDTVTVRPGESVGVPFTVTLPKDAPPGDHAGGIVASLDEERRAGVPIRLRVGGALKPSLAVEDVRLHDGTVSYTIHNTGNATLSARQSASVSGPFGLRAVAADKIADSPPLLPGATRNVSSPVHGVTPALRLTATVTLIPLLTDAAGSTAPLAATESAGHAWAVPWLLLLAIVVLGGLAALAFRSRRSLAAR